MKKISVIIPVLNEETTIGGLLDCLAAERTDLEIIVVDGGSTDNTEKLIRSYVNVVFLEAEKGRACQMNAGASVASGEILWFLHADSLIHARSLDLIRKEMSNGMGGGSFYLQFDKRNILYSFFSTMSRINLSIFTYGDQGIFISKTLFFQLNGFKIIPIMEDIDLVRRIKRRSRFKKLGVPVVTSARRFEKNGVVRQELKNVVLVLFYLMGVSPNSLARFYRD